MILHKSGYDVNPERKHFTVLSDVHSVFAKPDWTGNCYDETNLRHIAVPAFTTSGLAFAFLRDTKDAVVGVGSQTKLQREILRGPSVDATGIATNAPGNNANTKVSHTNNGVMAPVTSVSDVEMLGKWKNRTTLACWRGNLATQGHLAARVQDRKVGEADY
jgi:hypothetical protein